MAFIDMRMPQGWDGLETIHALWGIDPHVQVVICSAHSDYDWTEVIARLDHSDKLLVIKKPFEPIEVLQCANALTRKWENERTLRRQVDRKSTRLNSSHSQISYAVFCLKKKNKYNSIHHDEEMIATTGTRTRVL